jgi:glycosyltransferase involved in cell wall biosynthesis
MRKLLVITYYWPPAGGAGVQRWLKFSKYLPRYGWEPVILTVDPQFAAYPALDASLVKDISENIEVHRTKATDWFRLYTSDKLKVPSGGFAVNPDNSPKGKISRFIRGNFFIPDPRRGWNKFAFRKACELIETREISHIVTTSPPHSTQLIGLRLKKRFPEINWISDLRDAWTDIYYYNLFYPTFISKSIDRHFEKGVLHNADQIITVGNNLAKTFISKKAGIDSKIYIIPNGYDEEDFEGISPQLPDKFTITYTGMLSEAYPMEGFLSALAMLEKDGLDFLLRFAGIIPETLRLKINSFISSTKTEFISYIPHLGAIKLMARSSVLLLIIPETGKSASITPGKLFEYLASGKPVVCLGPHDGDAADILEESGHGHNFNYRDSKGILEYLKILIKNPSVTEKISPSIYRRDNLVRKIASLLKQSEYQDNAHIRDSAAN